MVRTPLINARTLSAALLLVAALLVAGCSQTAETGAPAEPAESATSTPGSSVASPAEEGSSAGNGNADVTYVRAAQAADGTWTFEVTVEHPDTGWEDYADGWDVVTPDGDVLKVDPAEPFTRPLAHPHVDEQPFTRSRSGIGVPDGVTVVVVRAHDLVDGYGGGEIHVHLEAVSGEGFEISR